MDSIKQLFYYIRKGNIRLFKREIKLFYQRYTKGFDDSELWSFDYTLAKHIAPRLKRFKETTQSYPPDLTEETWDATLDKMIEAFELCGNDETAFDLNQKQADKVKLGLELFSKYYRDLWS